MNKKPTLFLDMDGVLADFNVAAEYLLRASPKEHLDAAQRGRWPDHEWRKIANEQHFYRNLPKMQIADELVNLALKFRNSLDYDVKILTAIPHKNDMFEVFHDKIDWMHDNFGEHKLRVHFGPYSEDKQFHCQGPDDILVDDRTSNCSEWRSKGGIAVQVKPGNEQAALDELEDLFQQMLVNGLVWARPDPKREAHSGKKQISNCSYLPI